METTTHITQHPPGLYEKLIHLYPPAYLKKHRKELLQNFEDLERDLGSRRLLWAFIISDLSKSLGQQYMNYIKNHRWAQFAVVVAILIVILGGLFTWQVLSLQEAHSTFDHYAAFRGCEQITSQSDTQGTCITGSGQTVTIVKSGNRWFLQGDLPVCMIYIGSLCLVHQP